MRRTELIEGRGDLVDRRGVGCAAGRNAGGLHDPLGERLRSLELRGGPARAERRDAALAESIGDTGDQGSLGSDHDESDRLCLGERRDGDGVVRVELNDRDVLGDAGVSGGREDLVSLPFAAQRRDDRVFTGTGAEDEDSHPVSLPTGVPWNRASQNHDRSRTRRSRGCRGRHGRSA